MSASTYHLDLLKNKVITFTGLTAITPADCKVISSLVSQKTSHYISETTLKRIYGFALSKFNPSLFTINALAQYCDYASWTDFCEKNPVKAIATQTDEANWLTLQHNANKITNFTIQALKNRSGIPYNYTIKRSFIDHHFDEFSASENTGTIIASPAGYGKTMALCHWVDEKVQFNDNDIVLFFSSTALMNTLLTGKDLNGWIQGLLGYSTADDVISLIDIKKRDGGKFYLVVDGFDEHMFKREQFNLILNQLTDIFALYQSYNWFKLVLSMRSATWVNNRHEMEASNQTWFTGFKTDDECINVPLFSIKEIKQLCERISPGVQNSVTPELAESFKHPLYFQYYYKEHKDKFSLNYLDHTSVYELNSLFILNKIYLGQYSTEKILLIKKLVEKLDLENSNYDIDKLRVNDLIKKYDHAYRELISAGFLRELNHSNTYNYNTVIKFGNINFMVHSIAKTLLYDNYDKFDQTLIEKINTAFVKNEQKLPVLKWCIIHAIKTGQQESFGLLTGIDLTSNEKSDLIIFLGDLLENESRSVKKDERFMQYFNQPFSRDMFDYFFGLELINPNYKKTLHTLLKFELNNRKKILVYTSLAVTALINLNLNDLEDCIGKLRAFSHIDYQSFAINPLVCVDCLYHYFKYGIIKKEALIHITKLSFNPPNGADHLKHCASNDLLYLLGTWTATVNNNPKKTLRFAKLINNIYKSDNLEDQTSQFGFFAKMIMADAHYRMGEVDTTRAIYYEISGAYKKKDNLLTPYMKCLFYSLRIKVLLNTPREDVIPAEVMCLNTMVEEAGNNLTKLYVCFLLLKNDRFLLSHPNFKKQISYDFTKLVRDNGLNTEIFFYDSKVVI